MKSEVFEHARFYVKKAPKQVVKDLTICNHYLHRWPSGTQYCIGLYEKKTDKLFGFAVYGVAVGRRVVDSITNTRILDSCNILELTRLWIDDRCKKNAESWFLGKTFKWIRKNAPKVVMLLSYSDPMAGHTGKIYQATNWIYQGDEISGDTVVHYMEGEWLHPRSCWAKYGTLKKDYLKSVFPGYKTQKMAAKHRYIIIIKNKWKDKIMGDLKYPQKEYPKPNAANEAYGDIKFDQEFERNFETVDMDLKDIFEWA